MAGRIATKTNATLTAITVRIRQSMPDSEALNPISGKSHSKELLRVRPIWTESSTAYARYMAPPKSQPITPTGILGYSSRQASELPKTMTRGCIAMTRKRPDRRTIEDRRAFPHKCGQ